MPRLIFPRDFKAPKGQLRTSGDHIKVRDYFEHALQHPAVDAHIYFTERSVPAASDVWNGISPDRVLRKLDVAENDVFFVTGKEWKLLPRQLEASRVIQFVQSIRQCEPEHNLFKYLKRGATRICTSPEVAAAAAPHIRGYLTVIPNGIPLQCMPTAHASPDAPTLIWSGKQPDFGQVLQRSLVARGYDVDLLLTSVPRKDFLKRIARARVVVMLPLETEGFFMPALEAMACGVPLVCADAGGNRSFCIDGETCLQPKALDLDSHVSCVERLILESSLSEKLRAGALVKASEYSLEQERRAFHEFLNTHVLGR